MKSLNAREPLGADDVWRDRGPAERAHAPSWPLADLEWRLFPRVMLASMRGASWLVAGIVVPGAAACGGGVQLDAPNASAGGSGGASSRGTSGSSASGGASAGNSANGGAAAVTACPKAGAPSNDFLGLDGQRCARQSELCVGGCGLDCSCQSPSDDGDLSWHCVLHSCITLEPPLACPNDPRAVSRIDGQLCDPIDSTCGGCTAGTACTCRVPSEDALPAWNCVSLGCPP